MAPRDRGLHWGWWTPPGGCLGAPGFRRPDVAPFLLPAQPLTTLDEYFATETGGLGVKRAQDIGPQATIEEVTRSGLRDGIGGGRR